MRVAQEPACADQVHKVMTRAASNIRFNMPLASACADDREQFCGDVQPVRAPAPAVALPVPARDCSLRHLESAFECRFSP